MKKKIWLVLGIAGMLLGMPHVDAQAVVKVQIGTRVNIGGERVHRRYYHNRRSADSRRAREERRRRRDIEYRRHHQRRGSGVTIKF
ncbi:MAG: hypothetical protein HGB26_07720 [Desulfobulbaceae bacterium]|nr:hypothetical protein [Desulfobulbaceae bacterium]